MGFAFFQVFMILLFIVAFLIFIFFKGILVFIRGAKMKIQGGNKEEARMMLKGGWIRVIIPVLVVIFYLGCSSFSKLAKEKKEENFIVYAAKNEDYELVKELLESGVPADADAYNFFKGNYVSSSEYDTALAKAVLRRDYEMAELLLRYGANPDRDTGYKDTPFSVAIDNNDCEMIQLLLLYGADANYKVSSGDTYLVLACRKGYKSIVELLLENGANPNVKDKDGVALVEYENTRYKEYYSALTSEQKEDCKLIIELLKEYGAVSK